MFKKIKFLFLLMFMIVFSSLPVYANGDQENSTANKINEDLEKIEYTEFQELWDNGEISIVYFDKSSRLLVLETKDGAKVKFDNPMYDEFKKDLLLSGIELKPLADASKNGPANNVNAWLVTFLLIGFSVGVAYFSRRTKSPIQTLDSNAQKDKKQESDSSVKTFDSVAGLTEVKKDVSTLVDFIKNRDKYEKAGAKLPRGVILYGPPGTGKTLLAKAIAGEAGVPFLYMSGSEFMEMYVGVGAQRVRELFSKAKKKAPCIVFIDEIDFIGRNRGSASGSHSEDIKTINALLTEMDGFNEMTGVLVIGATNRIEDLDPALLRPGRFTNKYCVPLPETVADREEIIKIYVKNKNLDESISVHELAKETPGFSPAQIESLLNEAAIISVQKGEKYISKKDVDEAISKMVLEGHIREDQSERDEEELKIVAYHEAGHALVGKLFGKDITKVTILSSTSGAGGVTFSSPKKRGLLSFEDICHEVMELYAGRCAEYLYFGKDRSLITTGASNDIERATSIIHDAIAKYGFSEEFGYLNLSVAKVDGKVLVERETELAKKLQKDTEELIFKNEDKLKKIATKLLEDNTVYAKEIEEIVLGNIA